MSSTTGEEISNGRFSIPKASAVPKAEKPPSYRQEIKNFADIEETATKALGWVSTSFRYCKYHPKRKRTDDLRKIADEMWRVAKQRPQTKAEESENTQDTRANYPSTIYNETIKTITAGEKAVLQGNNEELPMEYAPLPGSEGYMEREGERVADDQNIYLAWTMEQKDSCGKDMNYKIGRSLFLVNKYADQVLEMDWDYRVEKRFVVEPIFEETKTETNEQGEVVKLPRKVKARKFVEKEVVVANNAKLNVIDMADCQFDPDIADPQNQSFFDICRGRQLGDVYALARSGGLKNVGKITANDFDKELTEEQRDRETNRGGDGNKKPRTNLVEIHKTRIRLPINDKTGEWDEDNEIPHWYETWWAGSIESGTATCLAIMPNVHHNKKIPVMVFHAFDDDNGAFNLGNPELMKAGYSMITTVQNQYFDNVTGRNQLPIIAERGSIGIRKSTVIAGGNRVIWKEPGFASPEPMDMKDTTGQTFTALDKAEDMTKKAAGVNKPLSGEGLGSRASASEAINALKQSLKPALEDAKFKSDQILPFCAEWTRDMGRQFSDPDQKVSVMYKGEEKTVFPGRLWGDQIVRVVAIKKMQDNIIRVAEEDAMMSQYMPAFKDYMTAEGISDLAKQIAKNRDFTGSDGWFKTGSDADAKHVAASESWGMLMQGIPDFPTIEQNHPAHIQRHKDVQFTYELSTPKDQQNAEGLRLNKDHIRMHQSLEAQAGAGQAQGAGVAPQQEAGVLEGSPRSPGEASGDIIAGGAANVANTGG